MPQSRSALLERELIIVRVVPRDRPAKEIHHPKGIVEHMAPGVRDAHDLRAVISQ